MTHAQSQQERWNRLLRLLARAAGERYSWVEIESLTLFNYTWSKNGPI